jgi:ubiquinone/menaquinone biosynthesis C-methylase UbiE
LRLPRAGDRESRLYHSEHVVLSFRETGIENMAEVRADLKLQPQPPGRRLPRWLLRLAFHLLYYQLAWTYDLVAWLVSFGQWAAWRRTAALFLREGPTLELACGTGGLMADLTACGLAPVGLDFSPYMARLARRRLLRQGAVLQLVRGQAQHLPFPDSSFANVVTTFPTDFILDPQTLASVIRILQPGGRLVVVVMGYLKGPGPLRRVVEWLYRITGQREMPEAKPLNRLKALGFDVRWEDATLEGAMARLLVATRRGAPEEH